MIETNGMIETKVKVIGTDKSCLILAATEVHIVVPDLNEQVNFSIKKFNMENNTFSTS